MSQQFDAIYENGMLRPLQPVQLPEQTRVKVSVEETNAQAPLADDEHQRQLANLREKLLVAERQSEAGQLQPLDAEETKQRLRDRLTQGPQ